MHLLVECFLVIFAIIDPQILSHLLECSSKHQTQMMTILHIIFAPKTLNRYQISCYAIMNVRRFFIYNNPLTVKQYMSCSLFNVFLYVQQTLVMIFENYS